MFVRFAALTLAGALAATAPLAQEMTPEEVKRLALEAILENPEIVMEAIALIREREGAEKATATEAAILELQFALYEDPNAPVIGNPEGDVTVVEFFDYNCPYCKQAAGEVKEMIAADPNVRVVYREWPILGEGSLYAARAALAARVQGKYEEFHWALMEERARKDEAVVLRIAADLGLDLDRLKADMEDEMVGEHISKTNDMARALGFTGTPSFVVGGQGVFGLVPAEDLIAMIADVRANGGLEAPSGN